MAHVLDKYELKIKTDQIKKLVGQKRYQEAVEVAGELNWSKIKDWQALAAIVDAEEAVGNYEDARDAAITAYNRNMGGRKLVRRLTEIFIRLRDFDNAEELYKEYEREAKNDASRFILLYHLRRAQKAQPDELIKILEDYKAREIDERYMYRLAELYAKTEQSDKAIKLCDDLILWFQNGAFVERALRLKKNLGATLTEQQMKIEESAKATPEDLEETREIQFAELQQIARMQQDDVESAISEYEAENPDAALEAEKERKEVAKSAPNKGGFKGFFKKAFSSLMEDDDDDDYDDDEEDLADKNEADAEASSMDTVALRQEMAAQLNAEVALDADESYEDEEEEDASEGKAYSINTSYTVADSYTHTQDVDASVDESDPIEEAPETEEAEEAADATQIAEAEDEVSEQEEKISIPMPDPDPMNSHRVGQATSALKNMIDQAKRKIEEDYQIEAIAPAVTEPEEAEIPFNQSMTPEIDAAAEEAKLAAYAELAKLAVEHDALTDDALVTPSVFDEHEDDGTQESDASDAEDAGAAEVAEAEEAGTDADEIDEEEQEDYEAEEDDGLYDASDDVEYESEEVDVDEDALADIDDDNGESYTNTKRIAEFEEAERQREAESENHRSALEAQKEALLRLEKQKASLEEQKKLLEEKNRVLAEQKALEAEIAMKEKQHMAKQNRENMELAALKMQEAAAVKEEMKSLEEQNRILAEQKAAEERKAQEAESKLARREEARVVPVKGAPVKVETDPSIFDTQNIQEAIAKALHELKEEEEKAFTRPLPAEEIVANDDDQIEGQMTLDEWAEMVQEQKYGDQDTKQFSRLELERMLEEKDEKSAAYDALMAQKRKEAEEAGTPFNEELARREMEANLILRGVQTDLAIRTGKALMKLEESAVSDMKEAKVNAQEEELRSAAAAVRKTAEGFAAATDGKAGDAALAAVDAADEAVEKAMKSKDFDQTRAMIYSLQHLLDNSQSAGLSASDLEKWKAAYADTQVDLSLRPAAKKALEKGAYNKPQPIEKAAHAAALSQSTSQIVLGAIPKEPVVEDEEEDFLRPKQGEREKVQTELTAEQREAVGAELAAASKASAQVAAAEAPTSYEAAPSILTEVSRVAASAADAAVPGAGEVTAEEIKAAAAKVRLAEAQDDNHPAEKKSRAELKAEKKARKEAEKEERKREKQASREAKEAENLAKLEAAVRAEAEEATSNAGVAGAYENAVANPFDEVEMQTGSGSLPKDLGKLFMKYLDMPGMEEQLSGYYESLNQELARKDSSSGNILITGNASSDKTELARMVVRGLNMLHPEAKKVIAKTTGESINQHGIARAMKKLYGAVLIVERAGEITPKRMEELLTALSGDTGRMIVILEDDDAQMNLLLQFNPNLAKVFNHHIVLKQYTVNEVVEIVRKFALKSGYDIDDDALLVLYLKIDDLHNADENIHMDEVRTIVNNAIERSKRRANRGLFGKKPKHTPDGKLLLTEGDFKG